MTRNLEVKGTEWNAKYFHKRGEYYAHNIHPFYGNSLAANICTHYRWKTGRCLQPNSQNCFSPSRFKHSTTIVLLHIYAAKLYVSGQLVISAPTPEASPLRTW